jgi:predicted extracellular nuclease
VYVLDGGKPLHAAVKKYAGDSAPIQRCQVHKRGNVLDHMTDEQKPSVAKKLNAAYALEDCAAAKQALDNLHRELMDLNPSAARSLGEGLEETLTVHRLHVSPQLRKTLASSNVIESAFSIVERVCANVKRWHAGDQRVRWVGSGLLAAEKQFRRVQVTNRSLFFSESWKRWFLFKAEVSNAGRRRRVGYARAATFNGESGDPQTLDTDCLQLLRIEGYRSDTPLSSPHTLSKTVCSKEKSNQDGVLAMAKLKNLTRAVSLVTVIALGRILIADGSSGSGAVSITNGNPIIQDFNTLSNSTSPSNVLPAGWYLTELGTGGAADGSYVVGTGSSNAGGAYSFGASASSERALGSLGSGSVTPIHYGARFTNNSTGPITALAVSYSGEMWRRGTATGDSLTFSYSTTATGLTTGSFTGFTSLNFTSPGASCSATQNVATDGSSAPCKVSVSAVITGFSANPGSSIWIRWTDTDSSGSDDGLGIDNVTVTATISSEPTPPSVTGSVAPNPAAPGQGVTLSGTILPGFNPVSQSYTVTCNLSSIGGVPSQILPVSGTSISYNTTVGAGTALGLYSLPCLIQDDQNRSSNFNFSLTVLLPLNSSCGAAATPISAIQGSGPASALVTQIVDVEAVVTGDFQGADHLSGFYVQQPVPDNDPATSEGIFIFSSTPVTAGDIVRVRGKVAEFLNSGSSLTELSSVSSVQVCSSGNALPAPVDVALPIANVSDWERYEGMLVRFAQQLVVTGNFNLGQFGQIDLAPSVLYQPTQTPGSNLTWAPVVDLNQRSIIALDDASTSSGANLNGGTIALYPPPGLSNANTLRVGALVNPNGQDPVPLVGILDDRFGAYRIEPISPVTFSNAPNPRPDTAAVAAGVGARFKIVSANVLNYFTTLGSRGAATATELSEQRTKIVVELSKGDGDVYALSELQNFENGQTNGGTYTNAAISDLTVTLSAATGKNYQFLDTITLSNLAPGNAVADNGTDAIRSGIIYNASTVTPFGKTALYNQNDQNRPTLAQTFRPATGPRAGEQTFTVVVNHFRSKGSACGAGNDDPFQGTCNGMRFSMANNVRNWLAGNPTSDPAGNDRSLILVGDFNAYFGEDPIQAFTSAGYTDLINLLLGPKAYSYNFGSQAGYLDHALANAAALARVEDTAELHINADEPSALEALNSSAKSAAAQSAYYAPNEFAASDHDPIVVGYTPLLGDFNGDGSLDAKDRTALLRARGQSGSQIVDRRMDMNQDGVIDQTDFHIWQNYFNVWTGQVDN